MSSVILSDWDIVNCLFDALEVLHARAAARVCRLWHQVWTAQPINTERCPGLLGRFVLGCPCVFVARPDGGTSLLGVFHNLWYDLSRSQAGGFDLIDYDVGAVGRVNVKMMAYVDADTAWVILRGSDSLLVKMRLGDGCFLLETLRNTPPHTTFDKIAVHIDALLVLLNIEYGHPCLEVRSAASGELQRSIAQMGSAMHEMRHPTSFAAHGDRVYLADTCNHTVQMFRLSDGMYLKSIGKQCHPPEFEEDPEPGTSNSVDARIGSGFGEFDEPAAVVVGHDRLYVGERRGRRMQIFTLDGEPLHCIQRGPPFEIIDIAVDKERIWVAATTGSSYEEDSDSALHLCIAK